MSSVQSTPSKHRLSARAQAGNVQYKKEQIKADLEHDSRRTSRCEIDHLLQHFLTLTYEDGDEKRKFDQLQQEIEVLQNARYYPASESSTETETSIVSEEERKKIEERQKLMDVLLKKTLNKVLGIANRPDILRHLKEYCDVAHSSAREENRYAPFVRLCQASLEKLKVLGPQLPFRKPTDLDLCFLRADPMPIQSTYEGYDASIERKPDVGATSRVAAADILGKEPTHKEFAESCTQSPETAFNWEQLLMPVEFKVRSSNWNYKILKERKPFNDTERISSDKQKEDWLLQCHSQSPLPDAAATQSSSKNHSSLGKRKGSEQGSNISSKGSKKARLDFADPFKKFSLSDAGAPAGSRDDTPATPEFDPNPTIKMVDARIQCISYGLELLSHNLGVHHAISLLIIDDMLSIFHFDRQGIVHSDSMSFVQDFPRFLVLLFALQRFTLSDWGIMRQLNPNAIQAHDDHHYAPPRPAPDTSPEHRQSERLKFAKALKEPYDANKREERTTYPTNVEIELDLLEDCHRDPQLAGGLKSCELDLGKFLSHQPHCVSGRATAVVNATGHMPNGKQLDMVCKVYHPEAQRAHEGRTMQIIKHIAETEDPSMEKHLPTLYFHADVPGHNTIRIRSVVDVSWKGHRVTRLIGMKKLVEITTLNNGDDFIKAWFEVVSCHAFLWKFHVEHGDPSLNNMMWDPLLKCGVLTDFDLVLLQWLIRVIGTDRTGTIPFMAIDLLNQDYWDGKIKRYYHHELESFFWVVPYFFFLYRDGVRQVNTVIDEWRTSDFLRCHKAKLFFLATAYRQIAPTIQESFKYYAPFMFDLYMWTKRALNRRGERRDLAGLADPSSHVEDSDEMWQMLITTLESLVKKESYHQFADAVIKLESFKPDCKPLSAKGKTDLTQKYARFMVANSVSSSSSQTL